MMIDKENNRMELNENALAQVSGGAGYENLENIGNNYNKYARFVKTTNEHMPYPEMYFVQMLRDLAMISPLFPTLAEAIAWFEANVVALYPDYWAVDETTGQIYEKKVK